jgi:drug/metabolite transporter (DMT)-like permease
MTQSAKRRMTPPQTHKPATLALIAAFAAIYFIWGSTFLAIRFAVETLPPLLMMGTRHLVAGSLLLSFLLLVRKQAKPEPTLWLHALVAGGFCFLGCHGLLAWAEMRIDSGLAALLSATLPIFMVVLARLRGQERELTPRVLSGIAIGLIGVAILIPFKFDAADRPQWIAALSVIVCEILWACGAIYSRGVKTTTPATTFAAMQMICGGTLLWTTGLLFGEGRHIAVQAMTAKSLLALGFLIVFGSLMTFTSYTWLLKVSSPAVVSTHSYINPVVAVILGWALAGEQFSGRTLAGAAIVLGSVFLLSRKKATTVPEPEPEFEAAA